MHGVTEILENVEDYQLWEDLYEGDISEIFANPKMGAAFAEYGDQFRVNLAKIPVNVVADRLEIAAITVPDSEADTAELQEKVWDANELLMRAKTWVRKACMYGDGYLFVTEGDEDGTVEIIFNNPKTTRLIYDEENEAKVKFGIKMWREGKRFRATLYYTDRTERYVTLSDEAKPKDEKSWGKYLDDDQSEDDWEQPNEYETIQLFHLRNDEPYGYPEHHDALGPQNMINKSRAARAAGVDFQSTPTRWGIKDPGTLGEDEDDGIDWAEDDSLATRTSKATESKLKSGAGEFWNLEGYKAVGQFDPAQPNVFLDPESHEVRLLSTATSTPLHYFDPDSGKISGESRRAANEPTDKKVGDRQQRFGSTASKALSFALHVVQQPGTPYTKENAKKVDVRWKTAGVVGDREGWETIKMKVETGVPLRYALLEAGYTAEQCDAWGIVEETTDVPMMRQLDALNKLTQAIQGLGVGVSLEILDANDVKKIIDGVIKPKEKVA